MLPTLQPVYDSLSSHFISSHLVSHLSRPSPPTHVHWHPPCQCEYSAYAYAYGCGWVDEDGERLSHSRSLLSLTSYLLLLAFDFLLTYAALSIPYLVFGLGLVFPQIGDSCLINRPATSSKIDAPRVQRASESWAMENTPCDIDDHA